MMRWAGEQIRHCTICLYGTDEFRWSGVFKRQQAQEKLQNREVTLLWERRTPTRNIVTGKDESLSAPGGRR